MRDGNQVKENRTNGTKRHHTKKGFKKRKEK